MTFPVHRSDERTPYERGLAFGRAQARPVANTVALYRRMFAETDGSDAKAIGHSVNLEAAEQEEIRGIADGAQQDEFELRAANARTEILAGKGPKTECSVVGQGGLLAQNWDWHPDAAASTVVWIVEHEHGWFATLTEAGILGKIGLNDAGLGVCLNLLETTADGGLDGTPIHLLLRRTLQTCRSVDEAIELLTSASTSASSAVTVAAPKDVASVELSPGGANVIRGAVGAHTNHFLEPPRRGEDVVPEESPSTIPRLEVVRTQPLLDALRSHESHPKGVCRHLDPAEPWVEQTVTVASVVMNLAARRFHVAAGQPCTHEHVQIALPVAAHA
ncbi:C45 family peptidase [Solirubrobacter ginsenosidimutans]|uniref:C45 family peptidase n=1 Tax=Solirubrobacter ginsenosidimutans TaxID=490573 RepID=A0A9X3MQA4_9ACTN|nr:C45 family peptidase [Solirubrobacter ginsenosidimutans]MDA0160684.1 C45 family peptidase [Solirubrobacter ginsenosidimutans]